MPDNAELAERARLLIELDEPEALLESLKRACQAKAANTASSEEGKRWRAAASALTEATKTITTSQEPKGASHEPDKPSPEPGAVPAEDEASSAA